MQDQLVLDFNNMFRNISWNEFFCNEILLFIALLKFAEVSQSGPGWMLYTFNWIFIRIRQIWAWSHVIIAIATSNVILFGNFFPLILCTRLVNMMICCMEIWYVHTINSKCYSEFKITLDKIIVIFLTWIKTMNKLR